MLLIILLVTGAFTVCTLLTYYLLLLRPAALASLVGLAALLSQTLVGSLAPFAGALLACGLLVLTILVTAPYLAPRE